MVDSRRLVERFIETDPVIKKGLQRGIINSRALARFILESDAVDSSTEAILGIIRRYPLVREESARTNQILRDCEMVMRSGIGVLTLENGPEVMKRISEFASSIRTTRGENLRVVVAVKSVMVIADQKALEQFREAFQDKEVLGLCDRLVEISILMTPEVAHASGVISRITAELALNDVNLCGTICCSPELGLLVHQKDAPRALETLQRLISEDPYAADYSTDSGKKSKHPLSVRQAGPSAFA
jgi:hypothetical protein